MSKTILAQVDGFTPIIDGLAQDTSLITAAVFGRIWRFCQLKDGVCTASLETISEDLGLDRSTVMRHIKILVEKEYLQDSTPGLRNHPHVYIDTGKVGLSLSMNSVAQNNTRKESVAQRNTGVAQRNTGVAESHLRIQDTVKILPLTSDSTATPISNGLSPAQKLILESFNAKRFKNKVQMETIKSMEETYGYYRVEELVLWAAKQGFGMGQALIRIESAIKKAGTNVRARDKPEPVSSSVVVNEDGSLYA